MGTIKRILRNQEQNNEVRTKIQGLEAQYYDGNKIGTLSK